MKTVAVAKINSTVWPAGLSTDYGAFVGNEMNGLQ